MASVIEKLGLCRKSGQKLGQEDKAGTIDRVRLADSKDRRIISFIQEDKEFFGKEDTGK